MPAQPKFWHFNPVAFVEQMRRVNERGIGYVDWDFIKAREGKEVLKGYVPTKVITKKVLKKNGEGKAILKDGKKQFEVVKEVVALGKSGVTIASGFDIGQYSSSQIKNIFSSDISLQNLYLPYSNKRKQDAIDYLDTNPLTIDSMQARKTDELIKKYQLSFVVKEYNSYSIEKEFKEQSVGVQTVVASICFQYGAASKTLLNMWKALEDDDLLLMYEFWEERMLNTEYTKRRELELKYLKANTNTYK